jgi:uncharacterized membrane protein
VKVRARNLKLADGHFLAPKSDFMGFASRLLSPNLNKNTYNWLVVPTLVLAVFLSLISYLYLRNHDSLNFKSISLTSSQHQANTKPLITSPKVVSQNGSSASASGSSSGTSNKSSQTSQVTVNGKTVTVDGTGSYSQTTTTGNSQTSVDINNSSTSSGNTSNNNSSVNVNVSSNGSN